MALQAGKAKGLRIRYVLQAKWRIFHLLGPPAGPSNSLCCTSEFECLTTMEGLSIRYVLQANLTFSDPVGRSPQAAISLCFTSEMVSFSFHGSHLPGCKFALFRNAFDDFLAGSQPTGACKNDRFYKRIGAFPFSTGQPCQVQIRYVLQAKFVFSCGQSTQRGVQKRQVL